MRTFDDEERRARLARRHRLLARLRTDDVVRIADDLVALHSTDPVTVVLSAMVRMEHPSVAAVEQVVYGQRRLIRHHAMRRTLWLASPDTVRLMHAAATRKLVGPERRRTITMLSDSGVPAAESWLDSARQQILADLHEHGPSTAREIGQRVKTLRQPLRLAEGKSYAASQGAHSRVITLLGFEGRILRTRPTSWITGAYRYAVAEDWLAGGVEDPDLDEAAAATALAASYLRRFGPATATDLKWWMGWTMGLTRRALTGCGAVEVQLADGPGWVAPADVPDSEVPDSEVPDPEVPDPEVPDPRRSPIPRSPIPSRGWPCCRAWIRPRWAGSNGGGISRRRPPMRSTRSATVDRRSGSTGGSSAPGHRIETG